MCAASQLHIPGREPNDVDVALAPTDDDDNDDDNDDDDICIFMNINRTLRK